MSRMQKVYDNEGLAAAHILYVKQDKDSLRNGVIVFVGILVVTLMYVLIAPFEAEYQTIDPWLILTIASLSGAITVKFCQWRALTKFQSLNILFGRKK